MNCCINPITLIVNYLKLTSYFANFSPWITLEIRKRKDSLGHFEFEIRNRKPWSFPKFKPSKPQRTEVRRRHCGRDFPQQDCFKEKGFQWEGILSKQIKFHLPEVVFIPQLVSTSLPD